MFEKVNTGGVALSVFELMTATYAAEGYNLRDDWFGSSLRQVASRQKRLAQEPLLQVLIGDADMNVILNSHFIPADPLRADDFAAFYQARKQNLLGLIEKAMGKQAVAVAMLEEEAEAEMAGIDEDS
ncbi:MAG: hypothetical protein H6974_11665 [Gammaproteobacteria bacterium]|nr:hypothetical protein [Gammaproteobacteria bacterium]